MNAHSRIPVIDLAGLAQRDPRALRRIADEIGAAARGIGFFSIVNHGISPSLVEEIFAASRAFFALPQTEKDRLAVAHSAHYRGYVRIGEERLDPTIAADVKECFNAGPDLRPDDPDVLMGKPFHGPNQWPDLPGFRSTLTAFQAAALSLTRALHRAVAVDLGLPRDYFTPALTPGLGLLRLLRYPPHPAEPDGGQLGAGAHTDYGNLTLLAQDETAGLEVQQRDGTWTEVAPLASSFVCNIGDCLMRWTNDVYVSNAHRVLNKSGRERYSFAYFGDPNADALVSAIPSCVAVGEHAKYEPITYADYLRSRYEATYVLPRASA